MSLLDQLEEDKKALKAAMEGGEEEVEEGAEEEKEPEPAKEEPKEEPKKEEPKIEDPRPDSELPDAEFARIRRENAALKRKMAEKEELREETEQPAIDPIMQSIIEEKQMELAARELQDMEAGFRRRVADFDEVANAYNYMVMEAVRVDNPRMSEEQIMRETKKRVLQKAAQYYNDKLDPVEELYHDGKALLERARKAQSKAESKEEPKEEPKPDLKKVAANKERNSGMMGTRGEGGRPDVTVSAAAAMTPAEWSRLSKAEKARLLSETQSVGRR